MIYMKKAAHHHHGEQRARIGFTSNYYAFIIRSSESIAKGCPYPVYQVSGVAIYRNSVGFHTFHDSSHQIVKFYSIARG